jgi:replicative DNA helicase
MDGAANLTTPGLAAAPPHNTEVEAALLGAILTNNRVFALVADFLEPDHFFEPVHGWLFMLLGEWIDAGRKATPLSLKHLADGEALFEPVGGSRYLYELATAVVSVVDGRDYGETVHGLWRDRCALAIYEAARGNLSGHDAYTQTAAQRIEATIEQLSLLVETDGGDTGAKPLGRIAEATLAEIDRDRAGDAPVGVATGFADIDAIVSALMPGDLTLLGARPGMGKTAFAGNLAVNAAMRGEAVYFASLEMRDRQLARRHMGNAAHIATHQLTGRRARELSQRDMEALQTVVRQAHDLPLWIDDRPGLTVAAIGARARRIQRKAGLRLIVIDYLQLICAGAEARRKGNRNDEVGDISVGLKSLAKRLDVPVLALSQLSRRVEERTDKRPMLFDLRDSGSLEQDADNVLFLYREQYYLEREKDDEGSPAAWERVQDRLAKVRDTAEIIVAKQRQGPTGTATLHWNGALQRFGDLSLRDEM